MFLFLLLVGARSTSSKLTDAQVLTIAAIFWPLTAFAMFISIIHYLYKGSTDGNI
jgi:hypothetical protein